MTAPRIFVVCNALDDQTRQRRGIVTDSPAASRKVFLMCRAMRLAGVRPVVLSLGRGRQDGSGRRWTSGARRVDGVPVAYAPFAHHPLLSPLLSLLGTASLLWRLRRLQGAKTVLFYNAMAAYVPTLLLARALRWRAVLDLEDGGVATDARTPTALATRATGALFERLCSGGALLACTALARKTRLRPVACYSGTVEAAREVARWPAQVLSVLMGGTVAHDTGAHMLIDAIRLTRTQRPAWAEGVSIQVTGKGDAIEALRALADQTGWPAVTVHGRTTDEEYRTVVASCQVGLALKPRSGTLAQTTFPSKVIELAGAGLLVLTTDISDVRAIFRHDGAVYLDDESGAGLAERLRWIAESRGEAQAAALVGMQRVREACDPALAGHSLRRFLCGAPS
jgi:glycosyltransferase involved in cell wall biosynthesis